MSRNNEIDNTDLFNDVVAFIEQARLHAARQINSTLVLRNWQIGNRINSEILHNNRADYGKAVIGSLAIQLQAKYGEGYERTSLSRMINFARYFPDNQIVATLSQQLSWSHFVKFVAIEDELKRTYYVEMCRIENWSVRVLRERINSLLYERTALAKKPEMLIKQELDKLKNTDNISPDFIFHDPYILDFVGLPSQYSERDLENAILNEITNFLQEFGNDFCFVARQKKMSTNNTDRYLDLLMFHRGLRRLIAIELKLGKFEPSHKGQMEWYLNWLDKNERKLGEEKPLGIILCSDKEQEDIEYLEMDTSGIHVAQYLTQLPPKEVLEEKLKSAISVAREKYERLILDDK